MSGPRDPAHAPYAGGMDEPAFSDFGSKPPPSGTRLRSKAAVWSMILGLVGPISCIGGVAGTANLLWSVSYRGAVIAMVLPIVLSLIGLFLGAFAFFLIAMRPERVRGAGYAGAGLALNILGAALNILMATQVIRLGKMTTGTTLYALQTIDDAAIDSDADAEKIDAIFHESVRDALTPERLASFRERVQADFGEPDLAHGARSVGELLAVRWPDAARIVRDTQSEDEIPAVPLWLEKGNALVVLRVHEDVASQLISRGVTLEALLTDIRVVGEDGSVIRLMEP